MIRKIKCLLFVLFLFFSCTMVYADSGVIVKKMVPIYDKTSGIKVEVDNNKHSVVFNDKNQKVQYKVTIKNDTGHKIKIEDVELNLPVEDFVKYSYELADEDECLKNNESKDLILLIETFSKEGWGRSFNDKLKATVFYDEIIENPATSTNFLDILLFMFVFAGSFLLIVNKNKSIKYITIILILVSSVPCINAKELMKLSIDINVGFESQNVMTKSYVVDDEGNASYHKYWLYNDKIKNFYIKNEKTNMSDYVYSYDVSEKQNGRVMAYLVKNKDHSNYYDLYLQADGIIYPNPDANFYFKIMLV